MSRVGFEPTTPVFQWAKTIHALDCTATVIGNMETYRDQIRGKPVTLAKLVYHCD
jgi:hypothetical protein